MLATMPARMLDEWIAYAGMNPFGERRADLRSAIIACVMANAWRGKNRPAFKVDDFMPNLDKQPERRNQTADEQMAAARLITAALKGNR